MIRVVVADDEALIRSGLVTLLASEPDIDVVGEASDGRAAVEAIRTHRPDVALMDVRMPRLDGVRATELVTGDPATAATRVLMLSTFDLDEYVFDALRAGASGFLLKDVAPQEFITAVRVVASGEAVLAPSLTTRLVAAFATTPATAAPDPPTWLELLTDREREVLEAVATGCSNAEIAERLHMSHATAKTHVSRLLAKLGARDRAQLVIAAFRAGIVEP